MWRPSFASIAVVAAFLHLALADTIQARDGKQSEKNAIIEPLGGTVDTQWPVLVRWKPETKGTISLKLLKGKAPDDMKEHETIADHITNTGIFIWLTGDWLEDSSTMKQGYKYGLKIIDDVTGDYDYSPAFDLKVPHSTFQQQKTGGHKKGRPKKGSKKVTPGDDKGDDKDDEDDADFEELEQVGTGKNHYHEHKKPIKTGTNSEDENPTVGVGKNHHGKPKPHGAKTNGHHKKPITSDDDADFEEPENSPQKGTVKYDKNGKPIKTQSQSKGSQKKPSDDSDDADDEDFVELDSPPQKGQTKNQKNSGKPKSTVTNPDDDDEEFDDEEDDFDPTGSTKPPSNANSNAKGKSNSSSKKSSSKSKKSGLGKGAVIGIVVAVIVVIVVILLAIGVWKLTRHKRVMAEKKRSRIGYDGVGGFIADGRRSVVYDGPPMTQYNPRGSVEGRYDPPTGQGLPVVGSTPRQSLDTRYDPPSRQSVDTRYDPPSQAKPAHH